MLIRWMEKYIGNYISNSNKQKRCIQKCMYNLWVKKDISKDIWLRSSFHVQCRKKVSLSIIVYFESLGSSWRNVQGFFRYWISWIQTRTTLLNIIIIVFAMNKGKMWTEGYFYQQKKFFRFHVFPTLLRILN